MNQPDSDNLALVPAPVVSGNGFASPVVFESDRAVAPSDGNDRGFPRDAAKYREEFWELGWTDGRLGKPLAEALAAVEWRAEVERNEQLSELRAELATAKSKTETITTRLGSSPDLLKKLRGDHDKLKVQRLEKVSKSSLPLGIIYTLVGFSLFVADLPLSLTLVARALRIPLRVGATSVHQLFQNPFGVIFGATWEAMFLAIGIAFSGVFVKFYLDEFTFMAEGESNSDEASAPPSRKAPFLMKVILGLFISTTILLGVFRAYGMGNPSNDFGFYLESLTFIALTLMFPVIGGVCFSAGWNRLEKAKQYYLMQRSISRLETKCEQLQNELVIAEADVTRLEESLKQVEEESSSNAIKQFKLSLYKHGYLRGYTLPETLHTEDRLFLKAKRITEKFLARDLRSRLWEGTDLVDQN
jgi:hypothetical protein